MGTLSTNQDEVNHCHRTFPLRSRVVARTAYRRVSSRTGKRASNRFTLGFLGKDWLARRTRFWMQASNEHGHGLLLGFSDLALRLPRCCTPAINSSTSHRLFF